MKKIDGKQIRLAERGTRPVVRFGVMGACVSCSSAVPEGSRFCPSCGSAVEISSENMTRTSAPAASPTSGAPFEGRFSPGTLLAGRYRIVGLVGRGGMGEVYRAEDLKLGQPVALKFLPTAVEKDPGRLSRFHGEVRLARQIAHPNVCRVYDIAESEGRHFLSMEYVDGEDLASLLKRIGRLPVHLRYGPVTRSPSRRRLCRSAPPDSFPPLM
jgi:serine/threonine-protein kinase